MTRLLAIAAGGAIGALLRFWVSTSMYALYVFMLERFASVEWRAALLIGLLGAFTTFSTFSLETLNLLQGGEQIKALLNIFVSVLVCLLATWLGMQLARQL